MRPRWLVVGLLVLWALVACSGGDDGDSGVTLAFHDAFDTAGNWRVSSDPEVEIAYAEGGLGIEIKVIDRVAWSVAGLKFQDGAVSVDARPIGGPDDNAFGLVIRHMGDRRFYRFEISSDGFFAVQAPQGAVGWEYLVDWTESPAIRRGRETNSLRVACRGALMTFYVNDVELTRVEDDRFAAGDVGVIAGTFYTEAGTHVLFDNFQVAPLPESD